MFGFLSVFWTSFTLWSCFLTAFSRFESRRFVWRFVFCDLSYCSDAFAIAAAVAAVAL